MTDQTNTVEQTVSVETAVNNLLRMVQTQLGNVISLVEKQVPGIDEAIGHEIDQYNLLVDRLAETQTRADNFEMKVHSLETELNEVEAKHADRLLNLRTEINQVKIRYGDYPEIKKELNRLKSMDPDSLSARVKSQRKQLDERLDTINATKSDNRTYRKENSSLKNLNAQLQQQNITYKERNQELEDRLGLSKIETINKPFIGKDGLECYVHIFHWPLTFHPQNKYIRAVSDFPFHLEVRTNRGICLVASCSSWLVPYTPDCAELEGSLPDELPKAIRDTYEQYAAHTHAHLLDRMDWAKNEELTTEIGLNEKQVDLLADSGFFSVYSVAHIPDYQLVQMAKGIGPKIAEEIKRIVEAHVIKWELENWTPEQIKAERK
ncbi:hypothetical protein PUN47_20925 [Vibrio fluvialis]|uniref:hypothetical protein n=1 Tax=Vibrio fluvialis TaxID=676 RepID=UPI002380746D|nr:hypothetical protein [Vibrio fluvialis]WDY54316.1 hypothetical protein PUN47_20925 [Vibrio fluvialis]